jgi:hypothetical protein
VIVYAAQVAKATCEKPWKYSCLTNERIPYKEVLDAIVEARTANL